MRLLNEWQDMELTVSMSDNPEKSEVTVFQEFVTKVMEIQRQLGTENRGDS